MPEETAEDRMESAVKVFAVGIAIGTIVVAGGIFALAWWAL